MSGFLFHEIIFGPVRSRRLGLSLGINLLPVNTKLCTFNCIYCECGWTPGIKAGTPQFPSRQEVHSFLERRLLELAAENYLPDAITFAGNGEPTMHPEFSEIIDDTLQLRDRISPQTSVAVLSNATMIHHPTVFGALQKIDKNILKLDAGHAHLFNLINNPPEPTDFEALLKALERFEGKLIIQSIFLRGRFKGEFVDNTSSSEVDAWIELLRKIRPQQVMIYPIARETPVHSLEMIAMAELERIARKAKAAGLNVQVYS